jgi:hypothetical protein
MHFRVRARHYLAVAGLLTGALAMAPAAYAAPALPVPPSHAILTFADKCLDVAGGSPADLVPNIQTTAPAGTTSASRSSPPAPAR